MNPSPSLFSPPPLPSNNLSSMTRVGEDGGEGADGWDAGRGVDVGVAAGTWEDEEGVSAEEGFGDSRGSRGVGGSAEGEVVGGERAKEGGGVRGEGGGASEASKESSTGWGWCPGTGERDPS